MLKPLWRAFHLQVLAAKGAGKRDWECYRDAAKEANGSAPTEGTCRAQASKGLKDERLQAALDHHRAPAAAKAQATFEDHITRLLRRATASAAEFGAIEDGEFKYHPGRIPDAALELVSEISHDKLGNLKLKMESRSTAESQLQKAMGWEKETPKDRAARELAELARTALERGVGGEFAAVIREAAGPEIAEAVARAFEETAGG